MVSDDLAERFLTIEPMDFQEEELATSRLVTANLLTGAVHKFTFGVYLLGVSQGARLSVCTHVPA